MNKHIVKHIVKFEFLVLGAVKVKCSEVFRSEVFRSVPKPYSVGMCLVLGALYHKHMSGLMNEHIVNIS
jgi:hypothetical protein